MRLGEFTDRILLMSQIFFDFVIHKVLSSLSTFCFATCTRCPDLNLTPTTDTVIEHKRRDLHISTLPSQNLCRTQKAPSLCTRWEEKSYNINFGFRLMSIRQSAL